MIHIIGGGLHGCFLAISLIEQAGVNREDIRIYDNAPGLLNSWFSRSSACKMQYLRSNSSHSIHPDFNHLRGFARERGIDLWSSNQFAMPYHRPSISLFNEHAQHCIQMYGLDQIHIRSRVRAILGQAGVEYRGEFHPGKVIIAGGNPGALHIPAFARALIQRHQRVFHVFEPGAAQRIDDPSISRTVIVGGGISAVQLAIHEAGQGRFPLLLSRSQIREFRFDFNPCYVGPRCQPELVRVRNDYGAQAVMEHIITQRYSGTVPPEIAQMFSTECSAGRAAHEILPDEEELTARLEQLLQSENLRVVLATGFSPPKNSSDWDSIDTGEVRDIAPVEFINGYPVCDENLQIAPGVFVSGMAASYRIGPAAANIIGAHLAWRRIRAYSSSSSSSIIS